MTAVVSTTVPAGRFRHEAFLYRGDDDYLAGVLPFVREGLERDETVIAAERHERLTLLRGALGADASAVRLLDMSTIGVNPARIISVWERSLAEATEAGRTLRGVGEPAWPGRREAELAECQLHELLLNYAFEPGPAWHLLCPYDAHKLPEPVRQGAMQAHAHWSTSTECGRNAAFAAGAHLDAFAAALPEPLEPVERLDYRAEDAAALRRTVAEQALAWGLSRQRCDALVLAAYEVTTNSLRHGGGAGTLTMWRESDAAILQFSDDGHVTDPLVGRRVPGLEQESGRGLYLVNHLCDLVQLRSSSAGTTVRLVTWL